MTESSPTLTPAMLHILLAIAGGARHGYGIMQEVSERTNGAMELGAGTLYRSIKKMQTAGWIEAEGEAVPSKLGPSRREYRITNAGRETAAAEVRHLDDIVAWARSSRLVDPRESA